MANGDESRLEAVILLDTDGSIYAVPRPALKRWRLPADVAALLAEPEVSGYLSPTAGWQVIGQATGEADTPERTSVSFTFNRISFELNTGKAAADDWQAH